MCMDTSWTCALSRPAISCSLILIGIWVLDWHTVQLILGALWSPTGYRDCSPVTMCVWPRKTFSVLSVNKFNKSLINDWLVDISPDTCIALLIRQKESRQERMVCTACVCLDGKNKRVTHWHCCQVAHFKGGLWKLKGLRQKKSRKKHQSVARLNAIIPKQLFWLRCLLSDVSVAHIA